MGCASKNIYNVYDISFNIIMIGLPEVIERKLNLKRSSIRAIDSSFRLFDRISLVAKKYFIVRGEMTEYHKNEFVERNRLKEEKRIRLKEQAVIKAAKYNEWRRTSKKAYIYDLNLRLLEKVECRTDTEFKRNWRRNAISGVVAKYKRTKKVVVFKSEFIITDNEISELEAANIYAQINSYEAKFARKMNAEIEEKITVKCKKVVEIKEKVAKEAKVIGHVTIP